MAIKIYPRFIISLCLPCILFIFLGVQVSNVRGQSTSGEMYAYCFDYTWLGPQYTNESTVNGTCEDLEHKPPICIDPLVYTADGSKPNTTAMWLDTEIWTKTRCRLTKNEVCAKWTYIFNGGVENETRLCTKIIIDGSTDMTSGCQTQFKDGYTIEVCACKTALGSSGSSVFPCNHAIQFIPSFFLLFVISTYFLLINLDNFLIT